tara:strand:- start:1054 stop:1434 length:381 start_codon:yes stop_codon:yes gene_type:complete
MTKLNQVYKCSECGNIVEVLHEGGGQLVCCGQPMELIEAKSSDEGQEKHVPVIEESPDGTMVKVGSVEHPMDSDHYIEWIEIITENGKRIKKFLKPGDKAEVRMCGKAEIVGVRAYCNIHGLWETK